MWYTVHVGGVAVGFVGLSGPEAAYRAALAAAGAVLVPVSAAGLSAVPACTTYRRAGVVVAAASAGLPCYPLSAAAQLPLSETRFGEG